MEHAFDKEYWQRHWTEAPPISDAHGAIPSPYLAAAVRGLRPGRALDAGCGAGTDAIWLAGRGWQVTGADISGRALTTAAERADQASVTDRTTWIEVDLTSWEPDTRWNLVVTSYAHPAMPQSAFYRLIAEWVTPGGTLVIVGHRHEGTDGAHAHESAPPDEATVTVADITALLDPADWRIDTAEEHDRPFPVSSGHHGSLRDVVVQATRLS